MSAAVFEERVDPGQTTSAVLALAVHLLLFAILVFGIRWQNRPPESVAVELWVAPPPAPVVEAPKPEPKPEPAPPVVVKPEPVIPKPQIVERKAPEKVKPVPKPVPKPEPKVVPKAAPKVVPKVEAKPVLKPEPLKPRVDDRRIREEMARELAREQNRLAIEREGAQMRDQLARDSAAARANALADWVSKVRAKIRGNIVLPQGVKGNPEAILDVVQLPNGEVISAKVRKSSGQPALDNAIERAVLKSSPLPRPDRGDAAPRAFELKYRPLD
jgi:colicin import membrane protein